MTGGAMSQKIRLKCFKARELTSTKPLKNFEKLFRYLKFKTLGKTRQAKVGRHWRCLGSEKLQMINNSLEYYFRSDSFRLALRRFDHHEHCGCTWYRPTESRFLVFARSARARFLNRKARSRWFAFFSYSIYEYHSRYYTYDLLMCDVFRERYFFQNKVCRKKGVLLIDNEKTSCSPLQRHRIPTSGEGKEPTESTWIAGWSWN